MLEVIGKENNDFIVKDSESGHILKIADTFAEMLPVVETSPANVPTLLSGPLPFFYYIELMF